MLTRIFVREKGVFWERGGGGGGRMFRLSHRCSRNRNDEFSYSLEPTISNCKQTGRKIPPPPPLSSLVLSQPHGPQPSTTLPTTSPPPPPTHTHTQPHQEPAFIVWVCYQLKRRHSHLSHCDLSDTNAGSRRLQLWQRETKNRNV